MAEVSRVSVLQTMVPVGTLAEFNFSLPSVVGVVPRVVDTMMSRVTSLRIRDGSEDEIELALQEALLNAIIHANKENPFKRVAVTLRCGADGEVQITVRDEGAGFDFEHVLDPTIPERLLCEHGRGILLMRAMMDEVSFRKGGSVVYMRKRANVTPRH